MRWRKPLVRVLSVAVALVLLAAAAILSVPLWIDSESVKTRISGMVAEATDGHAQFERIDLHFFPFPGATVTRLRFSLPGVIDLDAQSASIDLDLPALFKARVQPGALRVTGPQMTVHFPEPAEVSEPLSVESADDMLRGVLAQITEIAPTIEVEIVDGFVSLQARGRRPLSFNSVQLTAETERDQIDATVSCNSNLWDRLTLQLSITDAALTGHGSVEIVGLHVHGLGDILGQDTNWPVQETIADANLQWKMKGLTDVVAEGNLAASKISLRFGERHLDLLNPTIGATATIRDGATAVSVHQLVLDYPRLEASATLTHDDQGGVALLAQTSNADITNLMAIAAQLAPEVELLSRPLLQFEQGTITSAEVRSEAATFAGLFDPTVLTAQIEVAGVDVLVPDHDLWIRDFAASGSLVEEQLEVHRIRGKIGKSLLRDASMTVTLSDDFFAQRADIIAQRADHVLRGTDTAALMAEHITVSADADLSLDLGENLDLAKRFISDRKIQHELDRIKQFSGRAEVRAIATMNNRQSDLRLDVSELKLTTRHAAVPFQIPVQIKRGTVRYARQAVHIQDLEGSIGRTTFTGIGARVGMRAPNSLMAGKGIVRLELDELMKWAAAIPEVSKHLGEIKTITGVTSVSISKLEGPLRFPEKLQYLLAVSPKQVSIDAPRYGPRARLDGGVIDVANTRIHVRSVKVSALDASIRVSGATKDYRNGLNNLQVNVDGIAGLKSLEWLRVRTGLPETLRFASALKLFGTDAQWQRDGKFAAHGKVQVTDGPVIDVSMRGSPKHIEVKNINVRDDLSNADFGGRLENSRIALHFKGKLAGQSFASIFAEPPFEFGELDGDLRGNGDWKHPGKETVDGKMHGKMIGIPAAFLRGFPVPVTVENFTLAGQNRKLSIKTATVTAGDSHLDVSGSVDGSGERFRLDLDVRGKSFVVPLPTAKSSPESAAPPQADPVKKAESTVDEMTVEGKKQLTDIERVFKEIPVSGQMRVNIEKLHIGALELTPFVATASLENEKLALQLKKASLCNISLTGGLDALVGEHASINIKVHARDAVIEQSIACLTKQRIQLTGLMNIDASFAAAGGRGEFLDSARATYALSAHDGEIQKFDALEKVFVAVNATKAGRGKLPDISDSNLQYETISAKGHIDAREILFEQAVMDVNVAKIVAQGKIEFQTRKINATVLVAPWKTFNKIISAMPILGRIFGGTFLAVPVGVSGTIEKPVVLPLSPTAVTGRLLELFTNTLKLPAELANTELPEQNEPGSPPNSKSTGQ
jgi:hypothetical protein